MSTPAPIEEATGLDDQIADDPTLVVQKEIHDASDVAVGRAYRVPLEIFQASQHGFLLMAALLSS